MAKGVRPLGRVLRMKRAGPRPQRVAGRAVALIPVVIFAFPTPARPRIPKSPTAVKPQHFFSVRGVSPVGSARSTNVSPGGGAERIEHSGSPSATPRSNSTNDDRNTGTGEDRKRQRHNPIPHLLVHGVDRSERNAHHGYALIGRRAPGELAAPRVESRAVAGQPGMHARPAHLDGVYRDQAGQLRLGPTSLERRGGTLVGQQLGAELHLAAG